MASTRASDGSRARTFPHDQLELLQRNLVLSHAVGVGEPMSRPVVRLLMALKLSSLGRGHSGIRREVMDALITLFNADVLPVIPVKGSVGASGDLAPLAHMSAALLGVGECHDSGERMRGYRRPERSPASKPLTLQAKEGLALLNGTQASTALALYNMFAIEDLFRTGAGGGRAVGRCRGRVRSRRSTRASMNCAGIAGQIEAAAAYRTLLKGSGINLSHADCDKVQDPYSLRCQPQVMGACLDQMRHAAQVLLIEANAVSDNPLIFPDTGEVLSGGNFHAEPVAFAADNLALAAAEIGALAERRIALLIDATLSGLPPFLVRDGGVNSGFMIAHVTAAALASENKTLAHPASVDSLPTSANQEDHVSMATFAARKLGDIAENIGQHPLDRTARGGAGRRPARAAPDQPAPRRSDEDAACARVAHYELDHYFAPDIAAVTTLVQDGTSRSTVRFRSRRNSKLTHVTPIIA